MTINNKCMVNFDIHKIQEHKIFSVALTGLTLVCPGVLFLYIYAKPVFLSVNTFQLILLACSVSLPVIIINTMVFVVIGNHPKGKDYSLAGNSSISAFMSLVPLYGAMLISYFSCFEIGGCIITFIIAQIITWVITLFFSRLMSKEDTEEGSENLKTETEK